MALTQVRGSGISNMVISDAGIITKPLQPAFLARPASQQANFAINASVAVAMGDEAVSYTHLTLPTKRIV